MSPITVFIFFMQNDIMCDNGAIGEILVIRQGVLLCPSGIDPEEPS